MDEESIEGFFYFTISSNFGKCGCVAADARLMSWWTLPNDIKMIEHFMKRHFSIVGKSEFSSHERG